MLYIINNNRTCNRFISIFFVLLIVLMLFMGSYVQAEALVPVLAAIGVFLSTDAGVATASCLIGAAIATLTILGIDYYSGGSVSYHAKKFSDDIKNKALHGTETQETIFYDMLTQCDAFRGKTDAEIGQIASWRFTEGELSRLQNWASHNALSMSSNITSTLSNGTVLCDSNIDNVGNIYLNSNGIRFFGYEGKVFFCKSGLSKEDLAYVPFNGPSDDYGYIYGFGSINHLKVVFDNVSASRDVLQFTVTDDTGTYSRTTHFPVFGNTTTSCTYIPTQGLTSSSTIHVPNVSNVGELSNVKPSDILGTAPPIDPPITDTGSITQTWLGGILSTLTSSLTTGFDGVLTGIKNMPIPIVAPLAQILSKVTDLADTTATDASGNSLSLNFEPLKINFKSKFPFCIPFDFVNLIKPFAMQPQDFIFSIDLDTSYWSIHHNVDLSPFRLPILFFRYVVNFWFVWILISRTRDFMKW